MELVDLLTLDVTDPTNVSTIFSCTLELLEDLRQKEFDNTNIHKLPGVMGKFIDMVKSHSEYNTDSINQATTDLVSLVIKHAASSSHIRINENLAKFTFLHKLTVTAYNHVVKELYKGNQFSEFLLLYNPDLANKTKAIDLINEAMKLVSADRHLSKHQRRQITDALTKALNNLHRDTTDWTAYFGTIQQTITILGALGSLVGGVAGVIALKQAIEKIIEANNIVIQSSIQNYPLTESIGLGTTYNYLAATPANTPITRLCLPSGKPNNDK